MTEEEEKKISSLPDNPSPPSFIPPSVQLLILVKTNYTQAQFKMNPFCYIYYSQCCCFFKNTKYFNSDYVLFLNDYPFQMYYVIPV